MNPGTISISYTAGTCTDGGILADFNSTAGWYDAIPGGANYSTCVVNAGGDGTTPWQIILIGKIGSGSCEITQRYVQDTADASPVGSYTKSGGSGTGTATIVPA